MFKLPTSIMAALAGAGLFALAACTEPATTSVAQEEAAIRAQNAKWLEAITKRDSSAIAAMYAQDGEFMPPNSPKVTGRDAIKDAWEKMFQIPGVGLTFTTDKFVFAKGGDMAVDIGSYDFKSEAGGSSVSDKGKSVVTWVKVDGTWQILTDMFSSDAPPLPSTPTVPAPVDAPVPPPAPATTPVPGVTPVPGTTPPAPEPTAPPAAPMTPTAPPPAGSPATPPATTPPTTPPAPPAPAQ
jgi:uncharacterized protein (TIGR02246 family)